MQQQLKSNSVVHIKSCRRVGRVVLCWVFDASHLWKYVFPTCSLFVSHLYKSWCLHYAGRKRRALYIAQRIYHYSLAKTHITFKSTEKMQNAFSHSTRIHISLCPSKSSDIKYKYLGRINADCNVQRNWLRDTHPLLCICHLAVVLHGIALRISHAVMIISFICQPLTRFVVAHIHICLGIMNHQTREANRINRPNQQFRNLFAKDEIHFWSAQHDIYC